MENLDNLKPNQRLSFSDKTKDENKWGKECIDYFLSISYFNYPNRNDRIDKRNIQRLYNIYNNQLPEEWFSIVTNPYAAKKKEHQNFPAKIRPYPIIRNNVDLMMGQFNNRNFNYLVTVQGENSYNSYLEGKKEVIKGYCYQQFVNKLKEQGIDTERQPEKLQPLDDILGEFDATYRDVLSIKAQKWLGIFEKREHLIEEIRKQFKDFLISGECYSFKDVIHSEVITKRKSPLLIDYDKGVDTTFIEDGEWVSSIEFTTLGDIIEYFYEELKDDDKKIAEIEKYTNFNRPYGVSLNNWLNGNRELFRPKVLLNHVSWKSQELRSSVKGIDLTTGELFERDEDENYKLNPENGDLEISYYYRDQIWHGYRVSDGGKHTDKDGKSLYFRVEPHPVQRREVSNKSACKHPYNGRRWSDTHALNTSLVELAVPYQILYIIIQWRIEFALAKSKMFTLLDMNMIPTKEGWDEEKVIYYSEALGYFFIDRNRQGVDKSFNQYQTINMLQYEHIEQLIKIQDFISLKCDELFGFPPQAKGQMQASDAVGNTERSIFQSSLISDQTYTLFDEFLEREYQGFIDLSKFEIAAKEFRKLHFNDDGVASLVTIDADEYCNSDLGIFITKSKKEQDKLKELKALTQRIAQNPNVKTSTLAELIDTENFAEVKRTLKNIEEKEQKMLQAANADEHEKELALQESQKDFEYFKHLLNIEEIKTEGENKENVEYIKGDFMLRKETLSSDGDGNGIPDVMEVEKLAQQRREHTDNKQVEREKFLTENFLKNKELSIAQEKNNIEREKIKSKEKIEKEKNITALKNKVVGEKSKSKK